MGGKAAKERRRLARALAANKGEQQDSKQSPSTRSQAPTRNNNTEHQSTNRQTRPSRPPPRHGRRDNTHHSRHPVSSHHAKFTKNNHAGDGKRPRAAHKPAETEKKKVKKPKHLKRKIEKLSTEEEHEEERQKLVQELQQFQARKSAMASIKPAVKRHKPNAAAVTTNPSALSKAVPKENTSIEKQEPKVNDISVATDADTRPSLLVTPAVEQAPVATNTNEIKTTPATNDDSDSDSDSDVSLEDVTKRQRGRRRRGRKSTEAAAQAKSLQEQGQETAKESPATKKHTPTKIQIPSDSPKDSLKEDKSDPTKKTSKKNDTRRCIGRKPVTDFVVGQRYPGKVVYTKPFGAFIDVGCHSDAFCHVSRVQDDYVESITDVLCIGQEVHARVVEVDRKAKRITVSLQSDARIEDERASVEARKQRKEKQSKGKRSSSESTPNAAAVTSPPQSSDSRQQVAAPAPRPPSPMDESMMTPAELKRARKLARRAARREQQAQTGLAA